MKERKEDGTMYKRILLPLDGSDLAKQALPHATAHSERFQAELILLRVLEPFPHVRGLAHAELERARRKTRAWAREHLEAVAAKLAEDGIPAKAHLIAGHPEVEIVRFAEENEVDLIVICSRGRSGFSRWLVGGVADRVVRGATVPVLLVRAVET